MAIQIVPKRRMMFINSDLYQVLEPFIFVTRIFGFLPLASKKQGSGYILHFSLTYAIYSYLLAFLMMFLSMYGLHEDFHQSDSIRMKNSTVKYVTLIDLGEVILTVFIGIFVTPFKLEHFWKLLESLQKIDKVLPQKIPQNERKSIVRAMILGISCVAFVLSYELYLWGEISNRSGLLSVFLKRYLVIFCTYFMVFIEEMPYWKCTRLIRRRIESLNESMTCGLKSFKHFTTLWLTPIKTKDTKVSPSILSYKSVLNFMKIYEFIGESVDACNDFCAVSVLLIMFSCLLHLVVTPYFLLVEVANNGHCLFILLQFSWTLLHCGRLMVIVETCQYCLDEHQKTVDLVFKLLACDSLPDDFKDQLKLFALQLSGRKVKFTSFSMMKINRALLTAIGGSITTFLVILFQFGSVGSDVYYSRD